MLVLGASSPVGQFLLNRLDGQGIWLMAVSRRPPPTAMAHVVGLQHDLDQGPANAETSVLISLGPLKHALAQAEHMPRVGRVIALSSASTCFKLDSTEPAERSLIQGLVETEQRLEALCERRGIALTLLKPTLIYGSGRDANVARLSGLMQRLRLVPYCGRGLRQPVHADDLARLIVDCIRLGRASAGVWLLGGGETLNYPAMLRRIASASGRPARLLPVPLSLVRLALAGAHRLGRLRDIHGAMLARQRVDLVVDDQPARERLGWDPRPFRP